MRPSECDLDDLNLQRVILEQSGHGGIDRVDDLRVVVGRTSLGHLARRGGRGMRELTVGPVRRRRERRVVRPMLKWWRWRRKPRRVVRVIGGWGRRMVVYPNVRRRRRREVRRVVRTDLRMMRRRRRRRTTVVRPSPRVGRRRRRWVVRPEETGTRRWRTRGRRPREGAVVLRRMSIASIRGMGSVTRSFMVERLSGGALTAILPGRRLFPVQIRLPPFITFVGVLMIETCPFKI